jgi:hypothetical protein
VAVDGQVVIRPMMYLALTYDHRIVDGREAVTFLKRIKDVRRGTRPDAARGLSWRDDGAQGRHRQRAHRRRRLLMKKNKVTVLHRPRRLVGRAPGGHGARRRRRARVEADTHLPRHGQRADRAALPALRRRARGLLHRGPRASEVPEHLVVIGAGAVGLELGSVWRGSAPRSRWSRCCPASPPSPTSSWPRGCSAPSPGRARVPARVHPVTAGEVKGKKGVKLTSTDEPRAVRGDLLRPGPGGGGPPPQPRAPASRRPASPSTSAAGSRSTSTCAPASTGSTPSATWSAGRCWPTRPRTRASPSPSSSAGKPATSTTTPSPT